MTLPKLSIAAKLYAIFALMAATTLALSVIAVVNARHHAALTAEFESANAGTWNVERINTMIYAVITESRGISMASNPVDAQGHIDALRKINENIARIIADWQKKVGGRESKEFADFAQRIGKFRDYADRIAGLASKDGALAARRWSEDEANLAVRTQLNHDLEKLAEFYAARANRIYAEIDTDIDQTALRLSLFAALAVMLATAGALVISRGVARPLAAITRVTESVAAGDSAVGVPFGARHDEIGALARSIEVFQKTMQHVKDLSGKIAADSNAQKENQARMSVEVTRFSAEVEATLSELGRIADQMLAASTQLSGAADGAAEKTTRAVSASSEASSNVRDIASAADELSVSVTEIDRQVAQSNAIAAKAVSDAERTNVAVKELGEAAARIGDVVKLITDIAEQTNLLALNATIEAARAGEAGRGFAVVAGEVKALAGQTGRATEEIGKQIAGMQQATMRSIEAITAIEQTIRDIGGISGAIAAAVTEQSAATQEIARSVEIAAKHTRQTADEVGSVGDATTDTRASAGIVKGVADDLGQVAGRIRAQVDQFFQRLSA